MSSKLKNNVLICDPETGVCEIPALLPDVSATNISSTQKKVRVIYFTDPICSSCWGIEPQLRKLKLEYGDYFDIEYRMGGLLKGWNVYGGKDVSGPADVAQHWDEASALYDMPIDGDLWLEDPLNSSYPPSIAFKAAQLQNDEKAMRFLRRIKEMLFVGKRNISRWEYLEKAALEAGLDPVQLKTDAEGRGKEFFYEDLWLSKSLGVRGFPTIFFTDEDGNRFMVYGSRPYEKYEQALLKLYPSAVKKEIDTSWENLFDHYPTLTTKEFSILAGMSKDESGSVLHGLYEQKRIKKYQSKNGTLWSISKTD